MMPSRNPMPTQLLDDLLRECDLQVTCPALPLLGLTVDSRLVQPGWVFVALAGTQTHGMRYAEMAKQRGAVAILAEPHGEWDADCIERAGIGLQLPIVVLHRLGSVLSRLAGAFYGNPGDRLRIAGVTGTNGKTSVTHFLARSLQQPWSCGVIGTLGCGLPQRLCPATHTTPDAINLQRLLAELEHQGARAVAMEVSSHALHQQRVAALPFHTGVFTNLTREHLDYHGNMAVYADTKAQLFRYEGLQLAVINRNDEFGRRLLEDLSGQVVRISCGSRSTPVGSAEYVLNWHILRTGKAGVRFELDSSWGRARVDTSLLGAFNAENLALVLGVLLGWGVDLDKAVERVCQLRSIPGRMEVFGGQGELPLVVVDYAHTPDALQKALASLRPHARDRLICLFGCGGDRDQGKRPLMAAAAERFADEVWLTDDNPRHEDSQSIIADILQGFKRPEQVRIERDRGRAIRGAVRCARVSDVVLVAGKGHEEFQLVGELRLPFSDARQVQDALRDWVR